MEALMFEVLMFIVAGVAVVLIIKLALALSKDADQKPDQQPDQQDKPVITKEENEKNFLETMKKLGFKDPVNDFLTLTNEYKVNWQLKVYDDTLNVFQANSIIDGICLRVMRSTIGNNVSHSLIFIDEKKRFENYEVCGEPAKEHFSIVHKRLPTPTR